MRWMLVCCVCLACCSLDTKSSASASSANADPAKTEWSPRDTGNGRTATAPGVSKDASAPAHSTESNAPSKAPDAGQRAEAPAAKNKPKSSTKPAMDAGPTTPVHMSTPTSDASAAPMMTVDTGMPSPPPMDAGASAPASLPDAAVADAAQVDNILVWFALTGTPQQRVLMAALIADLEGRRQVDNDGMVSVLRNFDELQCRRNVQLCWQVCIWATSRCNVCDSWECQRLMYQHCGSDCRSDDMPSP